MDLTSLIPMLKSHGVTSFEGYGIKITLGHTPQTFSHSVSAFPPPSQPKAESTEQGQAGLPTDLKADDMMNYDKVLNWSSPYADEDTSPLPLANDVPVDSEHA